jgi:hypothetical protein
MGSRANYVLIEGTQAHLYYAHEGGLYVPSVMLTGPEATAAYMRRLAPDTSFMLWYWADGGILLDRNQLRARFWGGNDMNYQPFLRRPLLERLAEQWPGWRVEWASYGQAELAEAYAVYHPQEQLLRAEGEPNTSKIMTQAQLRAGLEADDQITAIVTLRWRDGAMGDFHFSFLGPSLLDILTLGPRLFDLLPRNAARPLLKEGEEPDIEPSLAFLDASSHTVWIGEPKVLVPEQLQEVQRFFPAWSIQGHTEGIAYHAKLSGRDSRSYQIEDGQAHKLLEQELARWGAFDPPQIMVPSRTVQAHAIAQLGRATPLGIAYAEAGRPEAELLAEIARIAAEQGWTSTSAEADSFDFMACAAYHGRWQELHPEADD